MSKHEIIEQTRLAFDFIQKLYLEVSYLVKEMEGLLGNEEEHFVIGRPSGYGITTRGSVGLEASNVSLWAPHSLAVFFAPEQGTRPGNGQTITSLEDKARVIYLRVILHGNQIKEPVLYAGMFYDFKRKSVRKLEKFEQVMAHIEYRDAQVFRSLEQVDYEDTNIAFKGKFFQVNLFDLNTSQELYDQVVVPVLAMFREQAA